MKNTQARIDEIKEHIDDAKEHLDEALSQYQSEVSMFGDAGPGQHPSLWLPELNNQIAELEAELAALVVLCPQESKWSFTDPYA